MPYFPVPPDIQASELFRNLADCSVPRYPFEAVPYLLERIEQPVGIMLVEGDVHALSADITFAPGVVPVRSNLGDVIIFDLDLQATVVSAK